MYRMSSLCDKLTCLNKRQELESSKSKLLSKITDSALVDFENVSMFQKNKECDACKHFLDWVDRNKIYAMADEIVANIDANKQRLNLASIKLNEFKDMYIKVRELATLAADDAHTIEQRDEFKVEAHQIQKQICDIIDNLQFNSIDVFNRVFFVRDDLESENRKEYNTNYKCLDDVDFSDAATSDKETDNIDKHLKDHLEPFLNRVESCYKELYRTKENILRQKTQGYKNLEKQRLQAKQTMEKKVCNIGSQIEYLNICISHNKE